VFSGLSHHEFAIMLLGLSVGAFVTMSAFLWRYGGED